MPGQTESTLTTPQVRNIRCTEQVHVNNCKDVCCYPFFRISTRIFRMYLLPAASRLAEPMFGTSISCGIATDAPVAGYLYEKGWKKGTGREKEEGRRRKYRKMLEETNKIPQKISTDNVPLPSKSKSTIRVSRCSDQCMAV